LALTLCLQLIDTICIRLQASWMRCRRWEVVRFDHRLWGDWDQQYLWLNYLCIQLPMLSHWPATMRCAFS